LSLGFFNGNLRFPTKTSNKDPLVGGNDLIASKGLQKDVLVCKFMRNQN